LLARAEVLGRSGRLADAEQCCRHALAAEPDRVAAHLYLGKLLVAQGRLDEAVAHLEGALKSNPASREISDGLQTTRAIQDFNRGMAWASRGRHDEAAACFQRAVERKPEYLAAQGNLGVALQLQGKLPEAVAALRRAVELAPHDAESHRKLAGALEESGARDEAVACCRRAVRLRPDHAESQNSLGVLLERQDRLDEAVACLREAVRLAPDFADAHSNLGAALDRQGRLPEALASLRRALELNPHALHVHINLGSVLESLGRYDEAHRVLERAVALAPDGVEARVNLGLVLVRMGRLDEARQVLERAVAIAPGSADAHVNLGLALERQGVVDAAAGCYRRAVALAPNYAEAHLNLGMLLLREGKFADGWREYEWRGRCERIRERPRAGPRWNGEPIEGRTILLGDEQGLGDSMQFVRFAKAVKERGAKVIVECRPQLAHLLMSCPGVDAVVATGEPLPEYDVHVPLASLPGILGTDLESIPAQVPYFFPDAALVQKWDGELGAADGLKVGIAWQGSPDNKNDRYRSIPLEQFAPLAAVANARLYSVQSGPGREQLAKLAAAVPIVDLGDRLGDFHNTAAILCKLDLVITCDSAPAHLAGALGIPVWVALAHLADWRWMADRADSPWYPTMRLYRQSRPGDWDEVFARIAADLAAACAQGSPRVENS
jgi:tetratricopeptide (TPR) repeat protein/ADP-heptose:LPS heptosyltransferase